MQLKPAPAGLSPRASIFTSRRIKSLERGDDGVERLDGRGGLDHRFHLATMLDCATTVTQPQRDPRACGI
jgi:hypothetical protein